ncbi:MAG TPA: hypothetical protein VGU20_03145 [Stellaceae bacterium]|nr:hypothetical protein [Stellaceae bacterium]
MNAARRLKKKRMAAARYDVVPTPERQARGDVERPAQSIADEEGRPARPFRAVDTLGAMLRRGTISSAMHQAGEDFRVLFHRGSLEPLARVPHTATHDHAISLRQGEARKKVWEALALLGGIASPAGSCVWHVVGCEWSLREWALRERWGGRPLAQETAAGILIGALGALQAHFGL